MSIRHGGGDAAYATSIDDGTTAQLQGLKLAMHRCLARWLICNLECQATCRNNAFASINRTIRCAAVCNAQNGMEGHAYRGCRPFVANAKRLANNVDQIISKFQPKTCWHTLVNGTTQQNPTCYITSAIGLPDGSRLDKVRIFRSLLPSIVF